MPTRAHCRRSSATKEETECRTEGGEEMKSTAERRETKIKKEEKK
jgi:hypothetical protein